MSLLAVLGIALVAFGALVLLKFPDRPGGEIRWRGFNVSSPAAGLPLIALGVAAVAVSNPSLPSLPGLAGGGSGGSFKCPSVFRGIPKDRISTLEEGASDRDIIRVDQPKGEALGIALTDNNQPIGALRLMPFPGDELFKVQSLVDNRCRQVEEFSNADRPGGDRRILQNWDSLRMGLGESTYYLRIGYHTATIRVAFRRVVE
jgi:hypothetical protein